jgi:hypothetical protein
MEITKVESIPNINVFPFLMPWILNVRVIVVEDILELNIHCGCIFIVITKKRVVLSFINNRLSYLICCMKWLLYCCNNVVNQVWIDCVLLVVHITIHINWPLSGNKAFHLSFIERNSSIYKKWRESNPSIGGVL